MEADLDYLSSHQARTDSSPSSPICGQCKAPAVASDAPQQAHHLSLQAQTTHYAVIELDILVKYLELFEQPEFHDLIIAQTALTWAQEQGGQKTHQRLRAIANDGRRNCVVIPNENFEATFVARKPGQPMKDRNNEAVIRLAEWYQAHLGDNSPIHIVYVAEDAALLEKAKQKKLKVQTLGQFVQNYYPKSPNLYQLYDSISLLEQPDDKDSGASQAAQGQADATTGYTEHKPDDVLEVGIKSGVYYQGKLQMKGMEEGWVAIDAQTSGLGVREILIPTKVMRNRAIHGDIVAVELLDKKHWVSPAGFKTDEEGDQLTVELNKNQPCGRIVGVVRRNLRPFVCTLHEDDAREGNERRDSLLVVPWDYRIPKIRIKTRQLALIANARILVRIDKWDCDSVFPQGHYVKTLGEIGQLETEIQVLMEENGINYQPFSPNMLAELPQHSEEKPWTPDPEEIKRRRDCRHLRVFSIDPPGSQDIDDALSVNILPNGNVEIGCHIADVTAFVKEGSLLDVEARFRSTSVYLADRRIDMLPALLSEKLCSIRQRQDRYAVSVIWQFDKAGNIVDTWYGKTVINSSYEMQYQQAQDILDETPEIKKHFGAEYPVLRQDMVKLRDIFRKLRARRLALGALELASVEIRFDLSSDKKPVGIKSKQELEVNALVAEYMILANVSVARFIYQSFPEHSLLRRHPLPRIANFEEVIRLAKVKNFYIDTSSNKALADSLSKASDAKDPVFNHLLRSLTTLAMAEAEYFSTGSFDHSEFYHYGLAATYYTHFTSPIRRYADVIVHRQLIAALEGKRVSMSNEGVQELATHINVKHRQAKQVQRDSTSLFEVLYFKDRVIEEDAVIFNFKKNGLYVFIPKFGLKEPVYIKNQSGELILPENVMSVSPEKYTTDIKVLAAEVAPDRSRLILTTSKGELPIKVLEHVTVRIKVVESRAHLASIRVELVHFGLDPRFRSAAKSFESDPEAVSAERISVKSEVLKAFADVKPQPLPAELRVFAQSSGDDNLELLCQKFRSVGLQEKGHEAVSTVPKRPSLAYSTRRTFQEAEYKRIIAALREQATEEEYSDYYDDEEEEQGSAAAAKAAVLPQRAAAPTPQASLTGGQRKLNVTSRFGAEISKAEKEAKEKAYQLMKAKRASKFNKGN